MSKLMWIAGILLIAAGIALGLMLFVSLASVAGWLSAEVPAIFITGGVLALGLGSVISSVDALRAAKSAPAYASQAPAETAPIPEFGRRVTEPAAAAAIAASAQTAAAIHEVEEAEPEVSQPVKETIEALEDARQRIEQAFEPPQEPAERPAANVLEQPAAEPPAAELPATELPAAKSRPAVIFATEEPPALEPVEEEAPADDMEEAEAESGAQSEDDDEIAEGQLYVVEERIIRARPARILSDGTVEAETDDGWMRFENLEHLDEYLDAAAQNR
jgi:hypothetical protein